MLKKVTSSYEDVGKPANRREMGKDARVVLGQHAWSKLNFSGAASISGVFIDLDGWLVWKHPSPHSPIGLPLIAKCSLKLWPG